MRLILPNRSIILPKRGVPPWRVPMRYRLPQYRPEIVPQRASLAFDNSVKGSNTSGTTVVTGGITTAASGLLIVAWAVWDSASAFTSLADNKGNGAPTIIQSELTTGMPNKNRFYFWQNAAGGAGHTFTLTLGTGAVKTLIVFTFTGALTSGALDANPALVDDASSPFVTASTGALAQANEVVIAAASSNSSTNTTWNNSSGYTIVSPEPDGSTVWAAAMGYKIVSSTSAESCTFTQAGTEMALAIASFKEAAGAGVVYTKSMDEALTVSDALPDAIKFPRDVDCLKPTVYRSRRLVN